MISLWWEGTRMRSRSRRWWFICIVVRNKEHIFRRELAKVGIQCFSPVETVLVVTRRGVVKQNKYLFGGYVFVNGDQIKEFRAKSDWRGFMSIISQDDIVSKIEDAVVMTLIQRQIDNEYGLPAPIKENALNVGETVFVSSEYKNGLYAGYLGKVLVVQRKKALLLMGNAVAKIPLSFLRKSADNSRPS